MAVEDRLYPSAENSSKHNLIQSILLPPALQATMHLASQVLLHDTVKSSVSHCFLSYF